jgi:hypothetical protein
MTCNPESFLTGETVPASGIYSVLHAAHRLFAKVAMFKGESFPKCARCSDAVTFRLIREFNGLDAAGTPSFRIPLYELAELDADSQSVSAT